MAVDNWWASLEEFRIVESVVVILLCLIALFFDSVLHHLRRWVLAIDRHPLHSEIPYFFELLYSRASTELMVLGFLAFVIWNLRRYNFFDNVLIELRARGVGTAGRALAAAPSNLDVETSLRIAPIQVALPRDGSELVHLVEDVHMQMFSSMCGYFMLMLLVVQYTRFMCEKWHEWEEGDESEDEACVREQEASPRPAPIGTAAWRARWRRVRKSLYERIALSDPEEFFAVKQFFVRWAQSGALSYIEERRIARLELEAKLAQESVLRRIWLRLAPPARPRLHDLDSHRGASRRRQQLPRLRSQLHRLRETFAVAGVSLAHVRLPQLLPHSLPHSRYAARGAREEAREEGVPAEADARNEQPLRAWACPRVPARPPSSHDAQQLGQPHAQQQQQPMGCTLLSACLHARPSPAPAASAAHGDESQNQAGVESCAALSLEDGTQPQQLQPQPQQASLPASKLWHRGRAARAQSLSLAGSLSARAAEPRPAAPAHLLHLDLGKLPATQAMAGAIHDLQAGVSGAVVGAWLGMMAGVERRFFSQQARTGGVTIDARFRFAEYLALSFAEQLEELVEFKPIAWLLVLVLRVLELICLLGGVGAAALELTFGLGTVTAQLAMWAVGRRYAADITQAARLGLRQGPLPPTKQRRLSALGIALDDRAFLRAAFRPSWFVRLSQRFQLELWFLRLLQALTWRNIFRVVEWLLGPQLRLASGGELERTAAARINLAVMLTMALAALLLPLIVFDWGLAMSLPPHMDDRNVEVAELVRAQPRSRGGNQGGCSRNVC